MSVKSDLLSPLPWLVFWGPKYYNLSSVFPISTYTNTVKELHPLSDPTWFINQVTIGNFS